MKRPSFSDFVIRVGGSSAAYLFAVLFAKKYYPGHEANAILIVSGIFLCVIGLMKVWQMHKLGKVTRYRSSDVADMRARRGGKKRK